MNDILNLFSRQKQIAEAANLLNQDKYSIYLYNATININYLFTSLIYKKNNQNIFYVAPNLYQATQAYEYFCQILGNDSVSFYVVDELVSAEVLATSNEFRIERMNTVKSIIENSPKIIVTHTYAMLKPIANKNIIFNSVLKVKVNGVLDLNEFYENLVMLGYKKTPTTYSVGEFSVRGGIIDIFPIGSKNPVRLDLFDDEIEQIRNFDPISQKSTDVIKETIIYPLYDVVYNLGKSEQIIQNIKDDLQDGYTDKILQDIEDIKNYNNLDKLIKYIHYIDPDHQLIMDYCSEKIIFFEDYNRLKDNFEQLTTDLYNYLLTANNPPNLKLKYFDDLYTVLNNDKMIFYTEFSKSLNEIKLTNIMNMQGLNIINYHSNIKNFLYDIQNSKHQFILAFSNQHQIDLMIEIFKENNITYHVADNYDKLKNNTVNIILSENSVSFGFINNRLEVYTEREIFKDLKLKKTKYKSVYQNTITISSKDDLSIGDYIVHYDYGIALYKGIKTIDLNHIRNDYLWLQYEDMELYIPLEDIHLIEKYQGSEGSIPKLTKLSTKEWEKRKNKIKSKIENIAKDLIKVQALRENTSGYIYPKDDELSRSFAADFEYDETPDQMKAIEEVLSDMESNKIMDRLICGDVGYGKTEIAMRAAFKAVLGAKQVLYLAPTTILSRQHFINFKNRFSKYGIRVELLSRLVNEKMQQEILKDLRKGHVDILIGTHRVLSDDVVFKDLGLFIIDEEQRFGVNHKEKIKKLKSNVEVLTLTATPIPRTLQMSIMGIRSISLLETPPVDRYPIQTFVLEENDIIIKEAIYRELARGGQVFYLHNRVSDLDRIYRKLHRLVPEAKIGIGHGQMPRDNLEDIIQAFIDREFDVLLCTTIIETGIDIPNANTLIISEADRLGLSQIYQIRGRVGRSDRIAYAYLMYSKNKVLTETGAKRLEAIKEFTELGSGYKIALRDLAIRGAGDILGKEQSGFIDALGLEMYMKLLNETIAELKNEQLVESKSYKSFNIDISKHVSKQYVDDEEIRILIHQEIFKIKNKEDKDDLIQRFTDRFGRMNTELLLYIERKYLEILMNDLDVVKFFENDREVRITFSKNQSSRFDGYQILLIASKINQSINFEYKNQEFIAKFDKKMYNTHWVYLVNHFLEEIKKFVKNGIK